MWLLNSLFVVYSVAIPYTCHSTRFPSEDSLIPSEGIQVGWTPDPSYPSANQYIDLSDWFRDGYLTHFKEMGEHESWDL